MYYGRAFVELKYNPSRKRICYGVSKCYLEYYFNADPRSSVSIIEFIFIFEKDLAYKVIENTGI